MPVESCIVRHDQGVSHEVDQALQRFIRRRRADEVFVVNVRELHDVFGQELPGVHECHVPIAYASVFDARSSNLDELVVRKRQAGGLGVEYDHVGIEAPKIQSLCDFRKLLVAGDYVGRSPVEYISVNVLHRHIVPRNHFTSLRDGREQHETPFLSTISTKPRSFQPSARNP